MSCADDKSIVLVVPQNLRRGVSKSPPRRRSPTETHHDDGDDVSETVRVMNPGQEPVVTSATLQAKLQAMQDTEPVQKAHPEALMDLINCTWRSIAVTVLHHIRVSMGYGSLEELCEANEGTNEALMQVARACALVDTAPTHTPCAFAVGDNPLLKALAASMMHTYRARTRFVDDSFAQLMKSQRAFLHFAITVFKRSMHLRESLRTKMMHWKKIIDTNIPQQSRKPFVVHAACEVADMQSAARTHVSVAATDDRRRVDMLDERVRVTVQRLLEITREKRNTMMRASQAQSQPAINSLVKHLQSLDEETKKLAAEMEDMNTEQKRLITKHMTTFEASAGPVAPTPSTVEQKQSRATADASARHTMLKSAELTARRKVLLKRLAEETQAAQKTIVMECTEQLEAGLVRFRQSYDASMTRAAMMRDVSVHESRATTDGLRHQLAGFGGSLAAVDSMVQCSKNMFTSHVCNQFKAYVVFVNKMRHSMQQSLSESK